MIDLNDPVWGTLHAAVSSYQNVLRDLAEGRGDLRENIEVLAEDLSHQLSWYDATAYVLPHLGALCGTLEDGDCVYLLAQLGAAIAAEASCPLEPDSEAHREFHEGLAILAQEARRLIVDPTVQEMLGQDTELAQMFALSALALLGDRRHAYDLFLLSAYCWQDGHAACACGWNNEEFPLLEADCILPAQIAPWDDKHLTDEAVWFSGLLALAGDEEIAPALPRVYGAGVCPQCGKKEPYWAWLDRFMEEY